MSDDARRSRFDEDGEFILPTEHVAQTPLVVLSWISAVLALTPNWFAFGPLGIVLGMTARVRGDRRGGAPMIASGVAMIVGAVVSAVFIAEA